MRLDEETVCLSVGCRPLPLIICPRSEARAYLSRQSLENFHQTLRQYNPVPGVVTYDQILMAPTTTLMPGEQTRPMSRSDALLQALTAKHTAQTSPSTHRREVHTTSSTMDSRREHSVASDHLDTGSDDGDREEDIDLQNIPALASALCEYVMSSII